MNNMKKNRKLLNLYISCIILLLSLLLIKDDVEGATIAGFIALVFSFLTIKEAKASTNLVILFSMIFYFNLSSYVLGPLTRGITFQPYQWDLWNSKYDAIAMKCILVSSLVFYISMCWTSIAKIQFVNEHNTRLKNNGLISLLCLFIVLLICVFSFSGGVSEGEYTSNDNPLFEYALFFFVLAWYYSGNHYILKMLWILCCLLYLITALTAADRSSAFMLLIVIALYYIKVIKLSRVFLLGFFGVLVANFIDLYRNGMGTTAYALLGRGLQTVFSDTVGHACYTSLTIYYYESVINNQLEIFISWLITLFSGSLFVDRESVHLPMLATRYYMNGGGGFFQPYFFFFFKYVGVALGTLLVSYLIILVNKSKTNNYFILLRYIIPAMSLRWYLYGPTTLFRACFIMFFVIFLLVDGLDKILKK